MQALEPVRVRDCECPGTPHPDGDIVYVATKLPLRGGLVAGRQLIERRKEGAPDQGMLLSDDWRETFVRYGAQGWNWTDAEGAPVPFDPEVLINDFTLAFSIANKADELGYGDAVLAPFRQWSQTPPKKPGRKRSKPSANGRMPVTTSHPKLPTPPLSE